MVVVDVVVDVVMVVVVVEEPPEVLVGINLSKENWLLQKKNNKIVIETYLKN